MKEDIKKVLKMCTMEDIEKTMDYLSEIDIYAEHFNTFIRVLKKLKHDELFEEAQLASKKTEKIYEEMINMLSDYAQKYGDGEKFLWVDVSNEDCDAFAMINEQLSKARCEEKKAWRKEDKFLALY